MLYFFCGKIRMNTDGSYKDVIFRMCYRIFKTIENCGDYVQHKRFDHFFFFFLFRCISYIKISKFFNINYNHEMQSITDTYFSFCKLHQYTDWQLQKIY